MEKKVNCKFSQVYWLEIYHFLDLNSILNLELVNKELYFIIMNLYQKDIENLPTFRYPFEYKKEFISLYMNTLIKYPIQKAFCNFNKNNLDNKMKETVINNKTVFSDIEMQLRNNKYKLI